jgi:hypothetical protein
MNALRRCAWLWLCRAAAGTLPGTLHSIPTNSATISEEKELMAAVFHIVAFDEFPARI